MSLHLIELPDELVAWLRGGKQGPAPAGLLDAVKLVEKAIDEPMECRTCMRWSPYPSQQWGECGAQDTLATQPFSMCESWSGR